MYTLCDRIPPYDRVSRKWLIAVASGAEKGDLGRRRLASNCLLSICGIFFPHQLEVYLKKTKNKK